VILLTGATGFVGGALLKELVGKGDDVLVTSRKKISHFPVQVKQCYIQELSSETDWTRSLFGIDAVIHTAARVHAMNDSADDPLTEYRKVNVEGTLNLARQAAAANVKRFIFVSSIKVNGEMTIPGNPFTADDQPRPLDPYGISKWETEIGLSQAAKETVINKGNHLSNQI